MWGKRIELDASVLKRGTPKVGEDVKVWLPGEWPWAECVSQESDGTWHGRILNKTFAESAAMRQSFSAEVFGINEPLPQLHDFKLGDIVHFVPRIVNDDPQTVHWAPSGEPAAGSA